MVLGGSSRRTVHFGALTVPRSRVPHTNAVLVDDFGSERRRFVGNSFDNLATLRFIGHARRPPLRPGRFLRQVDWVQLQVRQLRALESGHGDDTFVPNGVGGKTESITLVADPLEI